MRISYVSLVAGLVTFSAAVLDFTRGALEDMLMQETC